MQAVFFIPPLLFFAEVFQGFFVQRFTPPDHTACDMYGASPFVFFTIWIPHPPSAYCFFATRDIPPLTPTDAPCMRPRCVLVLIFPSQGDFLPVRNSRPRNASPGVRSFFFFRLSRPSRPSTGYRFQLIAENPLVFSVRFPANSLPQVCQFFSPFFSRVPLFADAPSHRFCIFPLISERGAAAPGTSIVSYQSALSLSSLLWHTKDNFCRFAFCVFSCLIIF